MKRHKIHLPMAAMILTAALAVPAPAEQQVPFKGSFQGNDAVLAGPAPGTALIRTAATGTGTHLGQFSFIQELTIHGGSLTNTGSGQWIAANGDIIYTTFVASALFGDVVVTVTEIHTITGGTGRFSGAQGNFTLHRTHVRAPSADGTHVTFGWFEGIITSPGAAH